ncbi:alpha/beta fold hydrolase [Bacillus xiapuensis]|uniref:alpha/beta fold hydrolase n=1 Tax=Bacillus xiapuensis TaxID=2014075 RepID=UPI001E4469F2|nr:alpha/beta hydrolase [Bacillus xiapuensis]
MLDYKLYEHSNSEEYVVLIHGMGGNSSIFYSNLKALKRHFNILSVHLPGHGKSPGVEELGPFSLETVAGEVIRLMDYLVIKKAHFIGISLGTIIIHYILKISPDRVRSAVMGGAITKFNLFSKVLVQAGKLLKSFTPFLWLYKICAYLIMPGKMNRRSRTLFVNQAAKMKRRDFLAWFHLVDTVENVYGGVPESSKGIPKLYISGSEDHLFIKQLDRDIAQDPYASMKSIQGCGHVCNVEKSKEFNEAAIQFLLESERNIKQAQ